MTTEFRFQRPPGLPLPNPPAEARPFFDAAGEGRLVVQQCTDCGARQHPPKAMCAACGAMAFEWPECSGRGVVYSYVVTHQAVHPALKDHVPMATAEIELEEGVRMTSNLLDVPPDEVAIGMPVIACFERVGEMMLPYFRRAP